MNIKLQEEYIKMYKEYEIRGFSKKLSKNDTEYSHDNSDIYFGIGKNALDLCVEALMGNELEIPRTILDIPSGSGRLLRHLKSYFKDSIIHASDLYEHHLDFCKDEFGVETFISTKRNEDLILPKKYDLIFVGSLLTHLPESGFKSVIDFLNKNLADNGIALVTLEGRYSIYAQHNKWKLIDDSLFEIAYKEYLKKGFGFVDYNNFNETFYKQENYGLALVHPCFAIQHIFNRKGLKLLSYKEQAWNNHQDCIVFQKTSFLSD